MTSGRLSTALLSTSGFRIEVTYHTSSPFPSTLNAAASSSTTATPFRSASTIPQHENISSSRPKGKQLEGLQPHTNLSQTSYARIRHVGRGQSPSLSELAFTADRVHMPRGPVRQFHATSRREAIPLIPATIGILKVSVVSVNLANDQSTSILAIVTTISRVLISFFPIGTLAAFRLVRGVRWLSSDDLKPDPSPEAEEFWKMWCEGERGIRLTNDDTTSLIGGHLDADGGFVGKDGRVAYGIPMPPNRFEVRKKEEMFLDPAKMESSSNRRAAIRLIRHTRFFLPELPTASQSYYSSLSAIQQSEVDALRRYWISLTFFKDGLRLSRWLVGLLLGLPVLLLSGVYLCGLERTPLTGRWRIILLTPEEEDAISKGLAGANWYRSIINLLTTADRPAPPVLPYEDWRWRWVQGILRRLEAAALEDSRSTPTDAPKFITGSSTPVPPVRHPLKPRPRMSWMLHSMLPGGDDKVGWEHLEIGPPYSLMLMEKDERNAFSYGFGGRGASGIVVFTGLLDAILREGSMTESTGISHIASSSSLGGLFSGIFGPSATRKEPTQPTEEQTLHLASVLAHEMGHLLLSHHVETLSQQQVLWPSVLGLAMDLARAFIWPLT